jgi:hypothetical protein
MDASALLSAISTDERSVDWFKLPLIASTAVVVGGLIIEYWPEAEKFALRQPNPDLYKMLFGGIVVTIAIAAEVLLTFFAQGAETKLRNDNKSYVTLLEKEASDTALKAEQLKAENLELEAQVAPRRVDQQCKDFPHSIKDFSGEADRVDSYILDIDGGILGAQIVGCLNSFGIKADSELSSVLPTGGFGVGVFVSGQNEPLVSAIKEAFVKANVRVVDGTGLFEGNQRTSRAGSPSNPAATVMVGIKPPIDMK